MIVKFEKKIDNWLKEYGELAKTLGIELKPIKKENVEKSPQKKGSKKSIITKQLETRESIAEGLGLELIPNEAPAFLSWAPDQETLSLLLEQMVIVAENMRIEKEKAEEIARQEREAKRKAEEEAEALAAAEAMESQSNGSKRINKK